MGDWPECRVDGCVKPSRGRTGNMLCKPHDARRRAGKALDTPLRIFGERTEDGKCSYPGCNEPFNSIGYCRPHAARARYGKPMDGTRTPAEEQFVECSEPTCDRMVRFFYRDSGKILCKPHYQRNRLGKDMSKPVRKLARNQPIGSLRKNGQGYMRVKIGPGRHDWMLEHRWVMEKSLERKLLKQENVHHVNGIKTDNRLENLELWISSHPSGQRVSDKVEWAEEIISLYAGN